MPTDINSHENKQGIERLAETVVLRRWEGKRANLVLLNEFIKAQLLPWRFSSGYVRAKS